LNKAFQLAVRFLNDISVGTLEAFRHHSTQRPEEFVGEGEIDLLIEELDQIQEKRGVSNGKNKPSAAAKQVQLLERQSALKNEINDVKRTTTSFEDELNYISLTAAVHEEKAKAAREKKLMMQEQRDIKLEDLTRGLVHYTKMGLSYETDMNRMWFKFTQIDPTDPEKEFKFALSIQDGLIYCIEDCIPALPEHILSKHIKELNASTCDDIPTLLRSLRKEFKMSVVTT